MEQVRLILAVVLSILVFLVWDYLFIPDAPPQPVPQQFVEENRDVQPLTEEIRQKAQPPVQPVAPAPVPETVEEETALPTFVVDTDLYSAELSGRGACFTGFSLKKYKETMASDALNKHLVSEKNQQGTACVNFTETGVSKKQNRFYAANEPAGTILAHRSPQQLTFFSQAKDDVVIEKTYTFYPDSYAIDLDVTIKNSSASPLTGSLEVSLNRFFSEERSRFVFEGPSTLKNGKLEEIKLDDINEAGAISGPLPWIAIQNRYFMSAVVAGQHQEGSMALAHGEDGIVTVQFRPTIQAVQPQTMAKFHFMIYMGPKDISILKGVGNDLDKAINFGWFDFFAKPCLWLMNQIYRIIPNYGVSIIILTLIIKFMFWPLGTKSYKSMGEMKKIQPLMAEIREKHKNDKKKMNEEMMGLYKTYKVNPLGGCLPMLVQIPVFIAFYRMLYQAIELRHAPFLLWINDLSAPERLFAFDVTVPFMQPPTGIPVMTIIMGATMFLQQKMQPAPGDPAQARIMLLMPIFLTVIFINFPSGLVLYFIVNNLFSIFQQHFVTRKNS